MILEDGTTSAKSSDHVLASWNHRLTQAKNVQDNKPSKAIHPDCNWKRNQKPNGNHIRPANSRKMDVWSGHKWFPWLNIIHWSNICQLGQRPAHFAYRNFLSSGTYIIVFTVQIVWPIEGRVSLFVAANPSTSTETAKGKTLSEGTCFSSYCTGFSVQICPFIVSLTLSLCLSVWILGPLESGYKY